MKTPKDLWKTWDECCFDCAVKRGWQKYLDDLEFPFQCSHRQDMQGRQHLCAGVKKALERYKKQ